MIGSSALPVSNCYSEFMDHRWTGELIVGDRWSSWRGKVGDARMHSHYAAQAVFGSTPVRAEAADGRAVEGRCVLIDPLVPHRLVPCAEATILFLEPCSTLDGAFLTAWTALRAEAQAEPARLGGQPPFWSTWTLRAAGDLDPRLTHALEIIDAALPDGRVDLVDVSRCSGLSSERFRHLFSASLGLPFSRYVLWRRLRLAVLALNTGADATTAAHTAGFADLPHFARTLRALFGISAGDGLLQTGKPAAARPLRSS